MRDPEMCFELVETAAMQPCIYRLLLSQRLHAGVEQYSRSSGTERTMFSPHDLHEQHEQFARQWDKNLRAQGFLEAFTDKSIRG
jgi:hypothetical protein